MAPKYSSLQAYLRNFRWCLPPDVVHAHKPVVILLHGLGGNADDWTSPFQERNWPYDHEHKPGARDFGMHSRPPVLKVPSLRTRDYLSPRLESNQHGVSGSDERSWWHALSVAGFPLLTYSQVGALMVPFDRGPVAEFKEFMRMLQRDVLGTPAYRERQVVILGHSRGGLIARAYLGDAEAKAEAGTLFPRVKGLVTLSSPHQGSYMALLDDKIIELLSTVQTVVPELPNDVGNRVLNRLKVKVDDYVGAHGDEIEPGSTLFRDLEAQEPICEGVRCISVGGTSPRLMRVYLWAYALSSMVPRLYPGWKVQFHWRAKAVEAKGASPIPDGLPLKLFGIELDEILPGRGDGLTADKRCRFPSLFDAEEHLSVRLSHAEELWDAGLQGEIVQRLDTFR
jgi:pimeloyl-ACP methyl ester carboxylesterase